MKKVTTLLKVSVFLLLLGFTMEGYAQQESTLGVFYALPVGDFGKMTLPDGGFSKPGVGLVFDSKYSSEKFPQGMSVNFHSSYQWNKMDNEKLSEAYTKELGNRTEVSNSKNTPIITTLGPCYNLALSEKISIDFNVGLGIVFNNTQAFTIKQYDVAGNLISNRLINFEDKVAFVYDFGIDLKFSVIPDLLAISLYTDYCAFNQKAEITIEDASNITSTEKMRFLNSGIKFVFYKQN